MENNYSKYVDQDGVVEEQQVVVKATPKTQAVLNDIKEIKDTGQKAIGALLAQINSYATTRGRELTDFQKAVAQDNLQGLELYRAKNNLQYKDMDFAGNNIYGKMLAYATQGLNVTDKDFAYVGYYSKAEKRFLMSMNLQYQGEKKLLSRYAVINGQRIHHYYDNIVYANDVYETEIDFENGEEKLVHKPNKNNSDVYKMDLNNVVAAYAYAYIPNANGGYSRIQAIADKKRILEAKSCTKTDKFWDKWMDRMVLKTVYHVLFKKMQSFIDPSILNSEDMKEINLGNKEFKHDNVVDVDTEVQEHAGNLEIGADF